MEAGAVGLLSTLFIPQDIMNDFSFTEDIVRKYQNLNTKYLASHVKWKIMKVEIINLNKSLVISLGK